MLERNYLARVHAALAWAAALGGRGDECAAELAEFARHVDRADTPGYAAALIVRARALLATGEVDRARADLQQAAAADPRGLAGARAAGALLLLALGPVSRASWYVKVA